MKQIRLDNCLINYQVFFNNNKNTYLRIDQGVLKITGPKKMEKALIEKLILKHKSWILKNYCVKKENIFNNEYMYLWGMKYKIHYEEKQTEHIWFDDTKFIVNSKVLNNKIIEVFYKDQVIEKIKSIIKEKKQILSDILNIDNVTYKAQLMKSRLGSCISGRKVIKLNSILARLDLKYLNLVLMHELVHLEIQNHSKIFHESLEKLVPNHRYLNRELKEIIKKFSF